MTNQDTALTNQDAFDKWWYWTDANLILCSRNSANAGYQAATKASEQRIQELEALLAKQLNAIEHAEYLAESAERLLAYLNDVTDEEECVIRPDDRYGDHAGSIRNYVYEFRKRAQRARVEK